MLQWMGGSRRKVNASRKSMLNKQKHYFEQRKRQQQLIGQENHSDVSNKGVHFQEEPRSLDVLSFINLATVARQGCSSQNGFTQPEMLLDNSSASILPENAPAAQNLSSKVEGIKVSASSFQFISKSTNLKAEEKQEEIEDENVVLALLSDENNQIDCRERAVPENHVAFSVGGLGRVGMETPAFSPRAQIRGFNSPPRLTRHKDDMMNIWSMPCGLRMEQGESKYDINRQIDGDIEVNYKPKGNTYGKKHRKTMKSFDSHIYSDMLDDPYNILGSCTEYFPENQKELCEATREYVTTWEKKSSYSDSHTSALANSERYGFCESVFEDFYLDNKRVATAQSNRFSKSGIRDEECNLVFPDGDRSIDIVVDLPSWSFTQNENLPDSLSSLSEESCSSTAGREDKTFDLLSHSTKLNESKKSQPDEVDITLMDLKEIKKNFMDELDMSLGTDKDKYLSEHSSSKARYFPKVPSADHNSDCIFRFKTDFCSDYMQGRSLSSMSVGHENSYEFSFENNISKELPGFAIKSNKPHTDTWTTKGCLAYPFPSGGCRNGNQMLDSVGQRNASLDNGESNRNLKLENKVCSEKILYSQSISDNNEETVSEGQKLNNTSQKSSNSHKSKDPFEEAETPSTCEDVSGLPTYIGNKVKQLGCSSPDPDPSEIIIEDHTKEKLGSEVLTFGSMAGKDFFEQKGVGATITLSGFQIHLLHKQFIWKLSN